MKKLLIAVAILMYGCYELDNTKVIMKRAYTGYDGKILPPEICTYWYEVDGFSTWIEFEDSCSKYSIGDTIKPNPQTP